VLSKAYYVINLSTILNAMILKITIDSITHNKDIHGNGQTNKEKGNSEINIF